MASHAIVGPNRTEPKANAVHFLLECVDVNHTGEAELLPSSAAELVEAGVLGSRRWCNYPFLVEAIVVGVSDGEKVSVKRTLPFSLNLFWI